LVEWIEDEPTNQDLRPIASEVDTLLNDVVRLSSKLMDQEIEIPDDIPELPLELSYWVASNLHGVPEEQQSLLEMQNTEERLQREVEILSSTRSHLAARTVLKDTLGDVDVD
jgi:ATP-dependent Lon protease